MNNEKTNNLIQFAMALAIVIGLVLVVFELRQTKSLVRTQLTSEAYATGIQRELAAMGESPMTSMAKACSNPEALTPEDALVLDRLYWTYVSNALREKEIEFTGDFDRGWEVVTRRLIPYIFNSEFGRRWWRLNKPYIDKDIYDVGEKMISSGQVPNCGQIIDQMLNRNP